MSFNDYDVSLVMDAVVLAESAHRGQLRKYTGEPYVTHCFRVGATVASLGMHPISVAAAILHDVVEDTSVTNLDIEKALDCKDVALLVEELTDVYTSKDYPNLNRAERKARETERLSTVSLEAKTIKIADLLDNLPSIRLNDPKFLKVFLAEKVALLKVLTTGFDNAPEFLQLANSSLYSMAKSAAGI